MDLKFIVFNVIISYRIDILNIITLSPSPLWLLPHVKVPYHGFLYLITFENKDQTIIYRKIIY